MLARPTARLRACVAAGAVAWSCLAGAVPFVVQLGTDRLVLDVPPGFSDTVGIASPRLNELAESVAGPSNRLLTFAITDGDLRRFMTGDPPDLKRYGVAATPREFETLRATPQDFTTFVADAMRGLGDPPAPDTDLKKLLETAPSGTAMLLAVQRREASLVSYLQGSRMGGTGRRDKPVYVLSSSSLLLVRGRPLNLTIITSFDTAADMEWLLFTSRRWLEQIQRLNP